MLKFQIESKAGVVFGVYEGQTAEDALNAMIKEAGSGESVDGNDTAGSIADWIITEVQ